HRAARRVDVEMNVLLGVLGLEKEQLRHDEVRVHVVDLPVHEHDAVLQEPRIDVVRPLPPSRLLDDDGNEVGVHLIHRCSASVSSSLMVPNSPGVCPILFAFPTAGWWSWTGGSRTACPCGDCCACSPRGCSSRGSPSAR